MNNQDCVQILLATYNGEKFISEQIDSLLNQTYTNIEIIVRDDGSVDNTLAILSQYCEKYPKSIRFISDGVKTGSAQGNFMRLIKYATAPYVMFCDQDDYWFANKVEETLKVMRDVEAKDAVEMPILVYSDYTATDAELKPLQVNKKTSQIYKGFTDINHLLVQNYVTGCTMMINKSLCEKICPESDDITMHDWWIALCASAFGCVVHISEPLMYYRQHGSNVVGAVDVGSLAYIKSKMSDKNAKKSMQSYFKQAKEFLQSEGKYISDDETRMVIENFIDISNHGKIKRMRMLYKGKYFKSTFLRTIGQFVYI